MFRWPKGGVKTLAFLGSLSLALGVAPTSAVADGLPLVRRGGGVQVNVGSVAAGISPPAPAARPLVIVRGDDHRRFEMSPATAQGGFDAADLAIAREAFSYRNDQSTHDVEARLLDLAYRAMLHFNAPHITLVSGFRRTRVTSRHSHGRAIDMSLPDVSVRALAAFLEQSGFVGVGIYPRSGFVHLDVRGSSYFWVDYARSGRRGRVRPRNMQAAQRYDQQARERGESPDPDVIAAEEREETVAEENRAARRHRARTATRHHRGPRHHRRSSRARAAQSPHSG